MYALIGLIIIIALSMLIVRIGAIALEMTGMSQDIASFQALSAFSGAGFTTEEAEILLEHPARRNVVQTLIRLGSVGVITAIASLVLSFMNAPTRLDRLAILIGSATVLVAVSRSRWFSRAINPLIQRGLQYSASFEIRDYTGLLRLHGDYRVADIRVPEGSWLAEEYIADLQLRSHEDVVILAIRRVEGDFIGAPTGEDKIHTGDTIIAYAQESHLQEIIKQTRDGKIRENIELQDRFSSGQDSNN